MKNNKMKILKHTNPTGVTYEQIVENVIDANIHAYRTLNKMAKKVNSIEDLSDINNMLSGILNNMKILIELKSN